MYVIYIKYNIYIYIYIIYNIYNMHNIYIYIALKIKIFTALMQVVNLLSTVVTKLLF